MFTALWRPNWSDTIGRMCLLVASFFVALAACPVAGAQEGAASNQVTDIQVTGAADDLTVTISTSSRPETSVFTMSAPSRIVVDIEDALPGNIASPVPVNRGPVKDILAKEFHDAEGTVTRITIRLDSVVDYSWDLANSAIRIKITPKAAGDGAEAGAAEEGDLIGAELARMETFDEGDERVEELTLGGSATVRATPTASGGGSSAMASGKAEILGLDFLPYQNRSRVRIKGATAFRYTASPVSADNQVVIDIPGGHISKALARPLDTSEFPSAVKLVSAYQTRGDPEGVRVAIKLREPVNYTLDEQGELLFVDFPVPEGIAAKLAANEASANEGAAVQATQKTEEAAAQGAEQQLISSTGELTKLAGGSRGAAMSSTGLVGAMDTTPQGVKYSGRKISIDVREADLHNVFRMISNVSKLNVVAGDNVKGKVTTRLQNVPWDQALAVILQSKGLGAVRFGNIIRIAPLSVLEAERKQQASAEKANRDLEPLQTLIIPLNYAMVTDVQKQVEGALTERGKLTLDTRTNSLIIDDTQAGINKARQLAMSLDTPTPQVLIEARIVEVSSTYLHEFGIQWGGDVNASADTGVDTRLYFPSSVAVSGGLDDQSQVLRAGTGTPNWVVDIPAASTAGALSLNLGSISRIVNVDARLSAIENMGKGKVISAPKVITVDNVEAKISQGTRIPYETVSAAGTSVQFIEATLELTVKPHITGDRRVFLQVNVSNNRPDFGQAVNGNPAIEVKEATTEVMVRDGDTTVLGGVYSLIESENVSGLPIFGRIPFLGWLFKGKSERSERKELLVFITPHVVNQPPKG